MTRYNEPDELLEALLELPAHEHDAFLDDQCGPDTALRAEVERLRHVRELPSSSSGGDDGTEPGSFVEELLGACPDQLWAPSGMASTLAASVSRTPSTLGDRYEIERELGRGGMGTVYLARDNKLRRRVALKMLPEVGTYEPRRRAMFEREACTAANLNHANVATVYEFEEFDGKPYIAMEYVEGRPLRKILMEDGPLPFPRLLDIALQITEGLHAAHRRSIIHRDLKPANVMVTDEGKVKILDFGLAKALQTRDWDGETHDDAWFVGSSGALIGTPGYMSPEQARREEDVDERTDLFALGIVLYEMATGLGPFHRDTPEKSISAALNETPRSITTLNSQMPPELADVINKLLEKRREDRYQSAEEVLGDLRALKPVELVSDKTFLTLVASVAVILLAVMLWLYMTERNEEPPGNITPKTLQRPDASAQIQEQVGALFETFVVELTTEGRSDNARRLHERMRGLDPKSPKTRDAGFLWNQAEEHDRRITQVRADVRALFDSETPASWAKARDEIANLTGQTLLSVQPGRLQQHPYKPARRCAAGLRTHLKEAVQSHARKLADSDIDGLKGAWGFLRTIDAPSASKLDDRIQRLTRLERYYEEAKAAYRQENLDTLTVLRGKMLALDPKAARTGEVEALVNALQNARDADKAEKTRWVYDAFREGSLSGFDSALGRLDGVPDELQGARAWLRTLAAAREMVMQDLAAASAEADRLQRRPLPPGLREDGAKHLRELNTRINRQRAITLCNSIQSLCRKRHLSQATERLGTLLKMNVVGLDGRVAAARKLVADLRAEKNDLEKAETKLREYLVLLHKHDFETAEALLQTLKKDWQAAMSKLRKYAPGPDLFRDRAALHLWLGAHANALQDAKKLETPEGHLLRGQALYSQGRIEEATAQFDLAAKAGDRNARAFYWRGICRHDLAIAADNKPSAALHDLERAADLGFRSAHACYRLALIHLQLDAPARTIELANKALTTPFAVDDHIACFEGNRAAYSGRPQRFWRDIYFWRGQGHFQQGHWRESIDDCTRAIGFDGSDAWCYFGRGRARIKLYAARRTAVREYDLAMKDFERAGKLGHSDQELAELLKVWKEYAEGIRG